MNKKLLYLAIFSMILLSAIVAVVVMVFNSGKGSGGGGSGGGGSSGGGSSGGAAGEAAGEAVGGGSVETCYTDQYVKKKQCLNCDPGKIRDSGDLKSGPDTECKDVVCE